MSGRRRSSTTQSAGIVAQRRDRLAAGLHRDDVDVVVAQQLGDRQPLGGVVLHHQQPLAARLHVVGDLAERLLQPLGRRRLGHEGERAARQAVLAVLVQRDDLHRDVPRRRILLELAEHRPAEHVGQEHVERDRGRLIFARQRQRIGAAHRDQHLQPVVVRQIDQDARIVRIVLDDQQHRIARLDDCGDRRPRSRSGARPAARGVGSAASARGAALAPTAAAAGAPGPI